MPHARDIFRRNFPKLEASGQVKFKRKSPTFAINGYKVKLVKIPDNYRKRGPVENAQETKWGFRRTGRKLLLIISPH